MSVIQEFREFAIKGNVVDMAVGIIIGGAFGTIVQSLVADIIMPPIGLALGGVDFTDLFLVIKGDGEFNTLAEATAGGAVTINYGVFINKLVSFTIVAFAVFLLVKSINTLKRREAAAPPPKPAEPPEEVTLLREIRDSLKR